MNRLIIVFLFFIQVDCLAQSFLPDESNIMSYEEILNLYPKSLTSHLPAKIDGMNLEFLHLSSPLAGRFLSYIHLVSPYDTKSEKLKNEVALKAKGYILFTGLLFNNMQSTMHHPKSGN